MSKLYTNEISSGAGFSITGPKPIDDRFAVNTYADLATFKGADYDYLYEGLQVYVKADKKVYIYKGTDGWVEIGGGGGRDFETATTEDIKSLFNGGSIVATNEDIQSLFN